MASSSLPFDLVEDIISRVPMESLIRFKRTSKQWYALCNDKRFIYKHLGLSKERLMRFCLDNAEIINPATLDLLRLPVPAEFSSVAISSHCNGLLLCRWYGERGPRYVNLAVWNPVLGQVKFVESSSQHITDRYGFGYDNNNNRDSYKILRISWWYLEAGEVEIYDFKSKLWRAFSATLDWSMRFPYQYVSLNGNMYWIAETKVNGNQKTFIISFDFTKETFKHICWFPFEVRLSATTGREIIDTVALSGFRVDRLSLFRDFRQCVGDETREMEVWVTNKVTDGVVSWSKYFNVARPDLPILYPFFFEYRPMNVPSFFINKTDSIVLWCDKVVGEDYACPSFYEIGQGGIKIQVETGQPFRGKRNPCLSNFVYVPSLVPVPE